MPCCVICISAWGAPHSTGQQCSHVQHFLIDVAAIKGKRKKKSWNIFKCLLIIQLEADWLPVMCWPLPVQSKSAGVSAPRGATVILGCGSSNSPTSTGTSTARGIKTSQYAQQLHSWGEGMCGMCLQHHNRTPPRSWTNMAKPSGDRTINTWSTLRLWAQSFCFILKGWNNFLRK